MHVLQTPLVALPAQPTVTICDVGLSKTITILAHNHVIVESQKLFEKKSMGVISVLALQECHVGKISS